MGVKRRFQVAAVVAVVMFWAMSVLVLRVAYGDDFHSTAQHLSDSAFAILNALTSDGSKAGAAEVMGAMASFAGDAQTLSVALSKGDNAGANAAMTALIADRRAVDDAMVKNPNAIDSAKWATLKTELASIQSRMPALSDSVAASAPAPPPVETHSDVVRPPASEAAVTVPEGAAPRVEITSRVTDDSGLHLKGYLEGTDLKSAGIYDNDAMIQKIDLAPTTGAQRVLLDFTLEQVSPTETIRVDDASGRTASIHIASNSTPVVEPGGHEKMIELGGGTSVPDAPPIELASRGPDNTAEIPSKSPSKRHIYANGSLAPLSDVQINILGVQQSVAEPANYQVVGQISGNNVKRAGIYIDGRLVKPIPVTPGGDSSFNVSFTMFGSEASIRAYGAGSNYVESSIDLTTANGAVYGTNPPVAVYSYPVNPYVRNPYGYPVSPYAANPCPPGYAAYPSGCQPAPSSSRPWWSKIF